MPLLQQVLEKYPEEVKIVFKNFPLAMHKSAKKAAAAVLAAREQGQYWEFHNKLMENPSVLNNARIQKVAEELHLDLDKFNSDISNPAINELIRMDIMNGKQSGVRGTPTVFINGKRMKKRSFQNFQKMIDSELTRMKKESAVEIEGP